MVERAKLLELAERCEAAEGPDRKLDEAIERATGNYNAFAHYTLGDDDFDEYVPTRYSASIDAAMSLVPEGFLYMVANVYDKKGKPCLGKSTAFICPLDNIAGSEPVNATTPALALTAAALHARATENTDAPDT